MSDVAQAWPPQRPQTTRLSAQQPRILAATSSMEACSPRKVQSSRDSPPKAAWIRARA